MILLVGKARSSWKIASPLFMKMVTGTLHSMTQVKEKSKKAISDETGKSVLILYFTSYFHLCKEPTGIKKQEIWNLFEKKAFFWL